MNRPVEPKEEDCCNSGCDPCVFDVYRRQLELYEKYDSGQLDSSTSRPDNLISETKYTPFKITYLNRICQHHWIIAFNHSGDSNGGKLYWTPGQHFLMKFSNVDSACSKAYTPIRLVELTKDNNYNFIIIVKKYIGGLVSNYLCSRTVGEEVLWRGPYGSFVHAANKYKRVCMIAQGTGITPLYSIINVIIENEDDYTNIILLCCYKCVDTILLRKELYSLRQYWNFNYKVFLSSNNVENTQIMYKEPIQYRKLDICDIKDAIWPLQDDAFLICGSSEFMHYFENNLRQIGVKEDRVHLF